MRRILTNIPGLVAGISEVSDGNMSFTRPGIDVGENRSRLLGLAVDTLITGTQPHGTMVTTVTAADAGKGALTLDSAFPGVEGFITQSPEVILGVTVADCLSVYGYDAQSRTIALVHAGWKSLLAGVIPVAVAQLKQCVPDVAAMSWAIGPHIQSSCFSVKNDVIDQFHAYPEHMQASGDSWFIHLAGIATQQLLQNGAQLSTIDISEVCTHCDPSFYSYRRDRERLEGAQLAFIALQ